MHHWARQYDLNHPQPAEEEHATVLVICSSEEQRTVRQMRKKNQMKVGSGGRAVPRPGERPTRSQSLGARPHFAAFRAKVKREQQQLVGVHIPVSVKEDVGISLHPSIRFFCRKNFVPKKKEFL